MLILMRLSGAPWHTPYLTHTFGLVQKSKKDVQKFSPSRDNSEIDIHMIL